MGMKEKSELVIDEFPYKEKNGSSPKEVFICEICGKKFSTKRGKNIHKGQAHIPP